MKKIMLHICKPLTIISAILLCILLYSQTSAHAADVKGIWCSYVDYEDMGLYNKSESEFTANADTLFKRIKLYGFNTVYFQVRPYNDAIYPSKIFKWCTYLAPSKPDYDPLSILIDKAHKYNLSFHPWINPYRVTTEKILNPAKASTINHIVAGVKEIIENYDVDGIHFDDYFYPSKKKGMPYNKVSISKRKTNVNKMVKSVYKAIKDHNPELIFGISPSGNVEYAESIGCDLKAWTTSDDYIDYIIPQLYWSDYYITGNGKTEYYTETLDEWTDLVDGMKDIYIGLALYKSGLKSDVDKGWRKSNHNITNQISLLNNYACDGYVMFSYRYIFTPDGKKEFANYMKYVSGLKLKKPVITIKKKKTYNLNKAILVKKKYSSYLTYSSDNKRIATVSSKGTIKAIKSGNVWITIKGIAGSKIKCKVKVR